ncbi:MAG TPA: hypothetical protein VH478_23685 [Trebonia sp.]|nr:hypothetical protein [Trebonia sp.]
MPVDQSRPGRWPPMLWIGGGQGAGKSTLAWRLSRARDLPLHRIDSWAYDHEARLPAAEALDQQLARGPEGGRGRLRVPPPAPAGPRAGRHRRP